MNILEEVNKIFDTEIAALNHVKQNLDESIVKVVHAVNSCKGKVIICGMGKPGHIAGKVSASMSSLGIHSYVLHPAEALHGDLGTLTDGDIIIIISNSGETSEVCNILPNIKMIGTPIIAITSNSNSTLAKYSDYLICLPKLQEACTMNLAPSSSTTAELVVGDAIAIVVSELRKIRKERFALYHPAGSLGKKLVCRVDEIMYKGKDLPAVFIDANMEQAIVEMCRSGLGAIIVIDENHAMQGLITDGDLKRYLERKADLYRTNVGQLMTKKPVFVKSDKLVVEALRIMESGEKQYSVLPVLDEKNHVVGLVRNHDIIKMGIFL